MTTLRFDCDGLASEWEGFEGLRNAMRAGSPLVSGSLGDFTVARVVQNIELLVPVLARSVACKHMSYEDPASAGFLSLSRMPSTTACSCQGHAAGSRAIDIICSSKLVKYS